MYFGSIQSWVLHNVLMFSSNNLCQPTHIKYLQRINMKTLFKIFVQKKPWSLAFFLICYTQCMSVLYQLVKLCLKWIVPILTTNGIIKNQKSPVLFLSNIFHSCNIFLSLYKWFAYWLRELRQIENLIIVKKRVTTIIRNFVPK